jgi:hypothetical protein
MIAEVQDHVRFFLINGVEHGLDMAMGIGQHEDFHFQRLLNRIEQTIEMTGLPNPKSVTIFTITHKVNILT